MCLLISYEGSSRETRLPRCNQIQKTEMFSYISFDKREETSNITYACQFKKLCAVSSRRTA